jgi:hypothetical protein
MANFFMVFWNYSSPAFFYNLRLREFKVVAQNPVLAHDPFMLADEGTSPEQVAALRALTGAQRLRLAERLYWMARKMKAAGLRSQHPDWPEERVNDAVREIFTRART